MLGNGEKPPLQAEKGVFVVNMGKWIYLKRPMAAGSVLAEDDICIKSPAGGLKPYETDKVIGHSILIDCSTGVDLKEGMLDDYFSK